MNYRVKYQKINYDKYITNRCPFSISASAMGVLLLMRAVMNHFTLEDVEFFFPKDSRGMLKNCLNELLECGAILKHEDQSPAKSLSRGQQPHFKPRLIKSASHK